MGEEVKQLNREELVKGKFAEVQKIIFSSGLTVGEIASILQAVQGGLNNLNVNMNIPVAPPATPVEEKVEEVKD